MFLPWRVPDSGDAHERAFVERLDRILQWARQIAAGDSSLAEDLAQDAFLHFTMGRPPIEAIGSLDKYLYAVLRNLNRSHRASISRRRAVSLDPLLHENAVQSWRSVNPEKQLTLRHELHRLCLFVCDRMETTKGASAFLFHFFHGLSIAEICAVMRTTRAAVDERLSVMRKEARRQMEKATPVLVKSDACSDADLMPGLYSLMAAACRGECFSAEELTHRYAFGSAELPRQRAAHLACCRACLSSVMQHLQLGGPEGPGTALPPATRDHTKRDQTRITRWQRRRNELLSIKPAELRLLVNGHLLATERVHPPDNDFSISVALREPIDFLELWSADDTRLLFLPVLSAPPDGEFDHHTRVDLNSGRLELSLRFTEPWPTVAVTYQMIASECPVGAQELSCVPPNIFRFSLDIKSGSRFSFRLPIRALSAFVAVMLIVVLLFIQTRETTLSAAELLTRAGNWQETLMTAQKPVLHRRFSLVLQTRGEPVQRTFVEVWRRVGVAGKFSRWSDASGRILAEARLAPNDLTELNRRTVWEFDPSADAFRAAGLMDGAKVFTSRDRMTISAGSAELTLDRATARPVEEKFSVPDGQYVFSEAATEIVPLTDSPLSAPVASGPRMERRMVSVEPRRAELSSVQANEKIEERELQVRRELHGLQVATAATVLRRDTVIDVELAPTSAEQEQQVRMALEKIPGVNISVLSPQLAVSRAVPAGPLVAAAAQNKLREPFATGWLKPVFGSDGEIHSEEARRIETAQRLVGLAAELRLLAERYSVSSEELLSADARTILAEMVGDLRLRIRNGVDEEKRAIEGLRNLPVDPAPVAPVRPCETWQSRATRAADLLWQNEQTIETFYAPTSTSGASPPGVDILTNLHRLIEVLDTTLQISCGH